VLDLPAIKKLCEAMPEGPWEVKAHCLPEPPSPPCTAAQVEPVLDGPIAWDVGCFIAATRTLVPQLVGELEEARTKLDAVDEWQEDWDGVGTIDWPALSAILGESE